MTFDAFQRIQACCNRCYDYDPAAMLIHTYKNHTLYFTFRTTEDIDIQEKSDVWLYKIIMNSIYLDLKSIDYRADFRFAPSQCETALLCNDVTHCLGASLESALDHLITRNVSTDHAIMRFVNDVCFQSLYQDDTETIGKWPSTRP